MTETKENYAATPQEINDIVVSGVTYQERLNIPVVAERVAREQYDDLTERFTHFRTDRSANVQCPTLYLNNRIQQEVIDLKYLNSAVYIMSLFCDLKD